MGALSTARGTDLAGKGMAAKVVARRLTVRGLVQTVGFRRYVAQEARDMGLAGHVRNLGDGSVEVVASGTPKALADFSRRLRRPPPPAVVRDILASATRLPAKVGTFSVKLGTVQEELQEAMGGMEAQFRDCRVEFGDYRGEFRGFADRTDSNFRNLGDRYDAISQKLSTIMSEMAEQTKKTTELLESFKVESKESREKLDESLRLLREAVDRVGQPRA